jgi:acyl-CoA hydrolase
MTITPRQALSRVAPGARVIASPGCATPQTLLTALADLAGTRSGLVLHAGLLLGDLPFLPAVAAGALRYRSWHVPAAARELATAGVVEYVPMRASEVVASLQSGFDCALIRVSAPDSHGYCSLGPSLTYTREAIGASRTVVAEIDPGLPRTNGDTAIHVSRFAGVIDATDPMCVYHLAELTDRARLVASRVAALLSSNQVLQLGIGSIPEAVPAFLPQATFGSAIFVGMITERVADLVSDVGQVAALRAVELMGTRRLMDFAHENPQVLMQGSVLAHDARRLCLEPGFCSVNSALAVDLTGQAACESIGGRLIGGVGGSVDFFDAARMSVGGQRILALNAETSDGRSAIVRQFPPHTPVTIPRHLVDVVVTEHGCARLAGFSQAERADALIEVAAPQHRAALSGDFAGPRAVSTASARWRNRAACADPAAAQPRRW